MLKRKAMESVQRWYKTESRKALCIIGARQTGKTTLVREFAKEKNLILIELNFLSSENAKEIFNGSPTIDEILRQISLIDPEKDMIPGKTIILLDEIQECPEARTMVKFLVEDGRFRYIETGSLLGVRLQEIRSVPVGYEQLLNLYPLDFEEFMWASKINDDVIQGLKNCFDSLEPVPDYIHTRLLSLFRTYLVVGGMPEAVSAYTTNVGLNPVFEIQNAIWNLYQQDIAKYAQENERIRARSIFDKIPGQLMESNKRFVLNKVEPKARFSILENALDWLTEAGLVLPCLNTTAPVFPLKLNEKGSIFKLFLLDTGLLTSRFSNLALGILQNSPALNWGAFLENCAAQILCANEFELYYYNSKNIGEIDFVIESGQQTSLIEMKSGKDFTRHPALDNALKQSGWSFDKAYVFCEGNIKQEGKILYLPWYMLTFLKNGSQENIFVPFNYGDLHFPD